MTLEAIVFLVGVYVGPLLGATIGASTAGCRSSEMRGALGAGFAIALLFGLCNTCTGPLAGTVVAFFKARWLGQGEFSITLAGSFGALIGAVVGIFFVVGSFMMIHSPKGGIGSLDFYPWVPALFIGLIVGAFAGSHAAGSLCRRLNARQVRPKRRRHRADQGHRSGEPGPT